MRKLLRSPKVLISLVFLGLVVVVSVLAPLLAPHHPLDMEPANALRRPSLQYPFGTDEFGRDILSRVMYGARPSLFIAVASTVVAALLGVPMGVVAAYISGRLGRLITRFVDALLCFPPVIVAMMIVGLFGPGVWTLTLTIGVLQAPRFARQAFGAATEVNHLEFVEAARALGAPDRRILWQVILPNSLAPLIVLFSLSIASAILLESGLSFLGLGVRPPAPSWGQMIGAARGYMTVNPGYLLWPSLVIAVTILAMNTLGDALRDYLDPRLR